MERERVSFTIAMDLDPVPGTFHTKEDAKRHIESMLLSYIPHYHPVVFS